MSRATIQSGGTVDPSFDPNGGGRRRTMADIGVPSATQLNSK